jgi:hypothetical protein
LSGKNISDQGPSRPERDPHPAWIADRKNTGLPSFRPGLPCDRVASCASAERGRRRPPNGASPPARPRATAGARGRAAGTSAQRRGPAKGKPEESRSHAEGGPRGRRRGRSGRGDGSRRRTGREGAEGVGGAFCCGTVKGNGGPGSLQGPCWASFAFCSDSMPSSARTSWMPARKRASSQSSMLS